MDAAEAGLLATDPANLGFDKRAADEKRTPETDSNGAQAYPEAKSEIEEGLHKLETLLESNVDRNFDKFEIYILRGVLNVPEELVPWVRLGHYEGIQLPTARGKMPTAEEVQQLQHKLRQTKKLNVALDATVQRNNAALEQLRALTQGAPAGMKMEQESGEQSGGSGKSTYTFLSNGDAAKSLGVGTGTNDPNNDGPLTTNTAFALSQLPALRSLLDELRPKLGSTGDAQLAAAESHSARERRLYLNNQTKKAVERQGVQLATSAEGLGRRVQGDEVAALEGIVDALSAGKKRDGDADDRMEE